MAVLTRHPFASRDEPLPGTAWKVDDVLSLGLFRYSPSQQVLECPYIWVWIMAGWVGDSSPLHTFCFDSYDEQKRQGGDLHAPLGAQCWQHWEEFNANFRCLKACLLDGQDVPLTQLHGARLDHATTVNPPIVHVQALTLVHASCQYPTSSSGGVDIIKHEYGEVKLTDCSTMVINGASAPAGDAFLCMSVNSPGSPTTVIREVQQYKLIRAAVTQQIFDAELAKSVNEGMDLFLLFTGVMDSTVSNLPHMSGIVDSGCFRSYFGPFAGRAFFNLGQDRPNINSAPRSHLEAVKGIGHKSADSILSQRPFNDIKDCWQKTKIQKAVLANFRF